MTVSNRDAGGSLNLTRYAFTGKQRAPANNFGYDSQAQSTLFPSESDPASQGSTPLHPPGYDVVLEGIVFDSPAEFPTASLIPFTAFTSPSDSKRKMSQPELPPLGHAVSGAIGASLSNTIVYPVVFPAGRS